VRSTEKRIFNFNLIEGGLMVAMAGLQVFIVKMFFTGGRKGEYRKRCVRGNGVLIGCRICMSDEGCRVLARQDVAWRSKAHQRRAMAFYAVWYLQICI
jgi:hypothetical protein